MKKIKELSFLLAHAFLSIATVQRVIRFDNCLLRSTANNNNFHANV